MVQITCFPTGVVTVKINSSSLKGTTINLANMGDKNECVDPGLNSILAFTPQTKSVPSRILPTASVSTWFR